MKKEDKPGLLLTALLLASSIVFSCNTGSIYSESEKIPDYTWDAGNIITFMAPVTDTSNAYDVNLLLRTASSYPYRNLFLFIKTTSPDAYSIKDTVEYFLADEKGDWYGTGLGDINELSVPFKANVLFPEKGTYVFSIQHGMREQNLEGVTDIGLQIIKTK
ncbi:MAG: gliding motility lipoprotein GldH [Bacteroidales bacterium]|nr:gliding motility lipoprotein GldH [Bacteroidales bacterium]